MRPRRTALTALFASPCLAGVEDARVIAYVSALTEDSILRLVDLNGDGDRNDADESAVFFGPGNAEGFPGVGSAQALLVLGSDDLLAADGEESGPFFTAVYRLRDLNGDGDAMDAGESSVWWDSVLPLPGAPNFDRPKAMLRLDDGTVLLADNNTINFDNDAPEAIWALKDLNDDGDVNDPGEAVLFLELAPTGSPFGFVCEDFELANDGRVYFTNLDSSTNTTNLWAIEPGPTPTLTPVGGSDDTLGILWKEQGLALSPFNGRPMTAATDFFGASGLVDLVDLNADGDLGDEGELVARYVSNTAADALEWDFNDVLDLETAPDGSVWLLEVDRDRLLRFEDLNADGLFQSAGEARVVYDAATTKGIPTAFPRRIEFALLPGCSDADLAPPLGVLNFNDALAYLKLFAEMDPRADLADPAGAFDFGDVTAFLSAFAVGCP